MSNSPAEHGFFISDYKGDERREIAQTVIEMTHDISLPFQVDKWGCVTATGAFIINGLIGEDTVTPFLLDESIDRKPNTPGDVTRLTLEFLKQGLYIDEHAPYSPLTEPSEKLAHGEIDFDTYLIAYQQQYGQIAEEEYKIFQDYYAETFIPALLASEQRFAPFKLTGQFKAHRNSDITETLLERFVNNGRYVIASMPIGAAASHEIALFRPDHNLPAVAFIPGQDNPESDSSRLAPLSRFLFDDLANSRIVALALWEASS